ncbi:hypothetical protein AALA26_05415, partial [Bifidobacterium pseudolongum]
RKMARENHHSIYGQKRTEVSAYIIADVSRIVVKIRSSGGKGYVRVNTAGDPTAGEQVAEFTFADGGTTEVKFTKPVDTQDIVMWVPMDSLPGNQLFIDSVQAF